MFKERFVHRLVGVALLALLTSVHAEIEQEWQEAGLNITTEQAVQRASDGQTIVPAGRYESIKPYGMTAVVSRQDLYGLIDAQGQALTPVSYSRIERIWRRGVHTWFAVTVDDPTGSSRTGVIDDGGRTLVEPAWESISILKYPQIMDAAGEQPGQAVFKIQRNGRLGAMNLAGRITIAPQFSQMDQFADKSTMVLLQQGLQQALCDAATGDCPFTLGQYPLEPLDRALGDDQLLLVGSPGQLGLFDLQGRELLPMGYDEITLTRPDPGRQPPLAVRKGLKRQWLELQRATDASWQARPTAAPRIQAADYDGHPQARDDRALIDARYLPVALHTVEQIAAALQDGRMQQPLLPSIQLSDRRAYVQFSALTPKDPLQTWPSVVIRCAWPKGFRLLMVEADASTPFKHACEADPLGGLHFQLQKSEQLTCLNCSESGLPTQWLREDPAPSPGCDSPTPMWSQADARRAYAVWVKEWARLWRPILKGAAPPSQERWVELVVQNSRAFSTLTHLRNDELGVLKTVGMNVEDPIQAPFTARMIDWLLKARPVRSGGLYPETNSKMAELCAEVWYLQLPGVESRLQGKHGAEVPLLEPYSLPNAGTLQRSTYPFLTFHHGPKGLQLAGISREFLQMVWWLEGGH